MTFPQLKLKIAWDSDPLAASPVYYELDPVIHNGSISRGRSRMLDRGEAGTMTLRMSNLSGFLDPTYTGGPYYGKIKLGAKGQLTTTIFGVEREAYTGYLDDVPRFFPGIHGDEVELKFTDGNKRLTQIRRTASFDEEASGSRIVAALDLAGWPGTGLQSSAGHRDVDDGSSDMQAMEFTERPVSEHLYQVELSELGRLYFSAAGAVTWVERHARLEAPYNSSNATFGNLPGDLPYRDITPVFNDQQLFNRVSGNRIDGPTLTYSDEASIAKYGEFALPARTELLLTSDNAVRDYLNYLLSRLKEPLPWFKRIEVMAHGHDPLWPVVLGHELGYRETVRRQHRKGNLQSNEVNIEHVTHTFECRRSQTWNTVYEMSLADPNDCWRLGVVGKGELGSTARWLF